MHEIAEYGVAAHWKYKEKGSKKATDNADVQFSWMRKMVEYDEDMDSAKEYVDSVKVGYFFESGFCIHSKGRCLLIYR